MTPTELTEARRKLGLKAADLGRALDLGGRDPGRMIRRWETGAHPMPGPVGVAVRLMLEAQARQGLQDALDAAQAVLTPAAPPPPALEAPAAPVALKTRRRG